MEVFIGRERELALLEDAYSSGGSAVAVYGRRRIGKTFLLERFCRGRRSLFLYALRGCMRSNLEHLSVLIAEHTGSEPHRYSTYGDLMADLGSICRREGTVVVIDEFPFLVEGCDTVSSDLRDLVDSVIVHTDSMLILSGSSVRIMEGECVGPDGGLSGCLDHVIGLGPLTFDECRGFHHGMDERDQLRLYLTVGGVPGYHRVMRQPTYRECIMGNFADDCWLADEAGYILSYEPGSHRGHMDTVQALSDGTVRQRDVVRRTGMDKGGCSRNISYLVGLGVVERMDPMAGPRGNPVYRVSDNFLAFNEEVVRRRAHLLSSLNPSGGYGPLEPFIDAFLGRRFEVFCRDYMVSNYDVLGTGWRADTDDGCTGIDFTIRISSGRNTVDVPIGCWYGEGRAGLAEYDLSGSHVPGSDGGNPRMVLLSASGFEGDLVEFASETGLVLIGPEELFGHRAPPAIV